MLRPRTAGLCQQGLVPSWGHILHAQGITLPAVGQAGGPLPPLLRVFWASPLPTEGAGLHFPARYLLWYPAQPGTAFGCSLSLLICCPPVLLPGCEGCFRAGACVFHKPATPPALHRQQRGPVPSLTQFGVQSSGGGT